MKCKTKVIEFNDIKPVLRVHLKLRNYIHPKKKRISYAWYPWKHKRKEKEWIL